MVLPGKIFRLKMVTSIVFLFFLITVASQPAFSDSIPLLYPFTPPPIATPFPVATVTVPTPMPTKLVVIGTPLPVLTIAPAPGSPVSSGLSMAQNLGEEIYIFLFSFEVLIIGITFLFFKDNVGEVFSQMAVKVIVLNLYFFLISNGPVIGQNILSYFQGNAIGFGANPLDTDVAVGTLGGGAAIMFGAANAATVKQEGYITTEAAIPACNPPVAPCFESYMIYLQHEAESLQTTIAFYDGIGVMLLMSAGAVALQLTLINIESYIVLTCGVFMLGFAAFRYTNQLSQNYFPYAINVSVKFVVTYIVYSMISKFLTIGTLSLVVLRVMSPGSQNAGIAEAVILGVQGVVASVLIYAIPAFASAFFSGQSSTSGSMALQQSGAGQMMSSMRQMQHALHTDKVRNRHPPSGPSPAPPPPADSQGHTNLAAKSSNEEPLSPESDKNIPKRSRVIVGLIDESVNLGTSRSRPSATKQRIADNSDSGIA